MDQRVRKNENWGKGGRYRTKGSITTENGLIGQKQKLAKNVKNGQKSILAKNVKIGNV